jgi:uncharacterized phage protein (TIGR02218 family)
MRKITDSFKQILQNDVTTLALCWKITKTNTSQLFFTEANHDIKIDNQIYRASTGLSSSAIKEDSSFAIDNLDIEGILDSEIIKAEDILAGIYDNAMIEIFLVDLTTNDENQNKTNVLFLKRGYIGNIKIIGNNKFIAEINGFLESGKQNITCRYGTTCRANLGDERCKFNLESFTHQGFVSEVFDNKTFKDVTTSQENGYFDHGAILLFHNLKFIHKGNVKFFINQTFELFEPTNINLEPGMIYYASIGCDKSANTCVTKFNNIVNFRGEPHIPGIEKLYRTKS